MTEITKRTEGLPALIDKAAKRLTSARTAGEILEAREQAKHVNNTAKQAAQMAKRQKAHAQVIEACHQMQADALNIEAQADIRLAEEYDAAQARGEVAKVGNPTFTIVPNGNNRATAADVGLTRKQVHEARNLRDAEKRDPGVIKRTLQGKVKSKEGPSRADVKRATREKKAKPDTNQRLSDAEMAARSAKIIALFDKGMTADQISPEVGGLNPRQVHRVWQDEKIRREAKREPQVSRDDLSPSAQQKFDAAIRQYKTHLDAQFRQTVLDEIKSRIEKVVLPSLQERERLASQALTRRKGVMDRATYDKIRRCLHPDSRNSVSDARLGEAFRLFSEMEVRLMDEKEHPTTAAPGVPDSYDDLMARMARGERVKRGRQGNSQSPLQRR